MANPKIPFVICHELKYCHLEKKEHRALLLIYLLTKDKEFFPFSRKEQLYLMLSLSMTPYLSLFFHAQISEHESLAHRASLMSTTQARGSEDKFVETRSTRLLPKL